MRISEKRLRKFIRQTLILEDQDGNTSVKTPTYDEFKSWLESNIDMKKRMLFMTLKRNVEFGNPREMIESNMFDIRDQVIFPSLKRWLNINITSNTHRMVENFLVLVSNAILSPVCKNISGIDKDRKLSSEDAFYFEFVCGFLRDYESVGIELDANDPEIEEQYTKMKKFLVKWMSKYNY